MEKNRIFLCFIVLSFFIGCDKEKLDSYPPYIVQISNISKKEREISIKLFKKTENNKKSMSFSIGSLFTNGDTPIDLDLEKDQGYLLNFSPYEDDIEDIGKENIFYYEVYENGKLIIDKKITIKSSYLDIEDKHPWGLKTDLFDVENKEYVKEVNKIHPFIKLEF